VAYERTSPPILLTKKHRADFAAFMSKWQGLLNLRDWRIGLSGVHASPSVLAVAFKRELDARLASIRLPKEWNENTPPTHANLEDTALHEILHVFLHELLQFASAPGADEDDIMSAEHRVVQTLVHLLLHTKIPRGLP
jgi:hypothetical protein